MHLDDRIGLRNPLPICRVNACLNVSYHLDAFCDRTSPAPVAKEGCFRVRTLSS